MDGKKIIKAYFDIGSPYSYAGLELLRQYYNSIWADLIEVHLEPVLLGGIFKTVGNKAPIEISSKNSYMRKDMIRCANWVGINLKIPELFPMSSLKAMRLLSATKYLYPDKLWDTSFAFFKAYWIDSVDITDSTSLNLALNKANISEEMLEQIISFSETNKNKEILKNYTTEAVEIGIFGCPTFAVHNSYLKYPISSNISSEPIHNSGFEIFFGADRLPILANFLNLPYFGPLINNNIIKDNESKL
uniref:Glutathione S-transferase kappa n=1 Tax=Nephromyces sp. MMRI TaxID=2496275 RepID=A0A3Q8UC07_9APIC|nr:glutathione S-transferase kappa 1 [Nephromyces sp. MMRI]AZL94633.1 glutathione S-transferase kappa 1 [Nephromyces sp. MMRI]